MQLTVLVSITCEFDRDGGEETLVDVLKLMLFVAVNPVNATESVQILQPYIMPAQDRVRDAGKTIKTQELNG